MPVLGWLLTGNVSHEASHFALSSKPWVNRAFSCTSAPMFFNSTAWYIQHIVQHHVYTNDENDVDLYHFLPVARTSRFSKYCPQFAHQWALIYLALPTSVCHLLFVVPLDLLTAYIDPVTGTRRYEQCENVDDLVAGAKKSIILEFALSFMFPILIFAAHGPTKGFCWLAMSYSVASACFIFFTQGAHLQEECQLSLEDSDSSWAKRQVLTSVNVEPESLFWSLASGGLNMQALHHILPPISASHLRDMYPRFREVCAKHNVKLKESPGMLTFFQGFLAWVHELSKPDAEDTHASSKAKSS
jgi:fatty acid desaturase